jgi:hypothetical protein
VALDRVRLEALREIHIEGRQEERRRIIPNGGGAAGRPGRSATDDGWLQKQLSRTDGYAETSDGSPSEGQSR